MRSLVATQACMRSDILTWCQLVLQVRYAHTVLGCACNWFDTRIMVTGVSCYFLISFAHQHHQPRNLSDFRRLSAFLELWWVNMHILLATSTERKTKTTWIFNARICMYVKVTIFIQHFFDLPLNTHFQVKRNK